MAGTDAAKKDLGELVKAYWQVCSIIERLRDEDVLNPHDCDNILGQLKSGMIEDILMYTRAHVTQNTESEVTKTVSEYMLVKGLLEKQNLSPEDKREIMGIIFKK